MPSKPVFRKSRIGIKRMLAKCGPTKSVSVDLPAIFKQMYAIAKMRKKGPRRYTLYFKSEKAKDEFMAGWKQTFERKA